MAPKKLSSRSALSGWSGRKRGRPLELKVKLKELMSRGGESVRVVKRARILQILAERKSAEKAAEAVGVSAHMARRVGKRYAADGLERALREDSRPGKEQIFNPRQEQELMAMLCGPSPSGRARWRIRLAAEETVKRGIVPKADKETVRVIMRHHALKPWREKNVVRPGSDAGVRREDGGGSEPLRKASEREEPGGVFG